MLLLCLMECLCVFGQTADEVSWDDFEELFIEDGMHTVEMNNEGTEEESVGSDGLKADIYAERLEQLREISEKPLNINAVNKEDLGIFPFLSEEQINDILAYVKRYGSMKSLGELMFIPSLGKREREMLRLFVTVDTNVSNSLSYKELGKWLKDGRNEMVARTDIPFYTKKGYKDGSGKPFGKAYRGNGLHQVFRYSFVSHNSLQAGLLMEKDPGERGVDYVSGYMLLKNVGVLKRLALGNYRTNFGKGLAVNTSMRYGKITMASTMDRIDAGFSKHSSVNETGYFRGAAATFAVGRLQFSPFVSYKQEDGTYNADSTGVTSLRTGGLHRTMAEFGQRRNLGVTNVGGNIHWENNSLKVSSTAVATHLNLPLLPKKDTESTLYRSIYPCGRDFYVGSMAYSYRFRTLMFSGETAYGRDEHRGGVATLNDLRWKTNGMGNFTAAFRNYSVDFISFNGCAFGENARVQNERGLYLSWSSFTIGNWQLDAYGDVFYFPCRTHDASAGSNGYEAMFQGLYSKGNRWNLLARYRIKSKQKDLFYGEDDCMLVYKTTQNAKLQMAYFLSSTVTFRTTFSYSHSHFGVRPDMQGFYIGENMKWKSSSRKYGVDIGVAYFHTDGYDAHIYAYEPTLLYSFGSVSYFDHGVRAVLLAFMPLGVPSLTLHAKLGATRYFNRSTIGSGFERIEQNHREDLQVQLRWKF